MSKMATNWDALLASAPLNKQAASDAAARGTKWQPENENRIDPRRSHAPIAIRADLPKSAGFIDLTGRVVGRLTVIGLAKRSGADGARWVVRCACGYYEVRASKVLKDQKYALRARCSVCDYQNELRAGNVRSKHDGKFFKEITP